LASAVFNACPRVIVLMVAARVLFAGLTSSAIIMLGIIVVLAAMVTR